MVGSHKLCPRERGTGAGTAMAAPGAQFCSHLLKQPARNSWSTRWVKVTLALKVLFALGITNSKNCVHLGLRT